MLKLFIPSLIVIQLSFASVRRLLHPHQVWPATQGQGGLQFPEPGPPLLPNNAPPGPDPLPESPVNPVLLPATPVNPTIPQAPVIPTTPATTSATTAGINPSATSPGKAPPPPPQPQTPHPEITHFPIPPANTPHPEIPITTAPPLPQIPQIPQTTGAAAPAPGTTAANAANSAAACTANCPFVLSPICGSDGQTYINDCLATCLSVTRAYSGPCTNNPPPAAPAPPAPPAVNTPPAAPLPPASTTSAPITVVSTQPAVPAVPATTAAAPQPVNTNTALPLPPAPPMFPAPAPPQPVQPAPVVQPPTAPTIFTPPQPPVPPVLSLPPIAGIPPGQIGQPGFFTSHPTPKPVAPLPGHIFGAYGQNCPIPTGTEQCKTTADFVSDQTGTNTQGITSCTGPNDCCLCSSIECGSLGSLACESLVIGGENAAFGVKDINVYSEPALFGGISCRGRRGCAETNIYAEGIVDMSCMGRHGCEKSEIVITNPGPEFSLTCGVTRSCAEAKITLNFTGPPSGNVCDPQAPRMDKILGGVDCIGVEGCKGMEFTVINNGCDNIILDGLECRQGSCELAKFNFFGTGPIGVSSCQLPSSGPQPMGVDRCFANLRQIACSDPNSCAQQQRTITDPMNGFMLVCENEMACAGSTYIIDISAAKKAVPTETISILCNSPFACSQLTVIINNENTLTPVFVDVICSGEGACNYATFTTGPNVMLAEVTCGNVELCTGCTHDGLTCGGHPAATTFAPITPPWFSPNPQQPVFPSPGGPQQPIFPSPIAPAPPVFVMNPSPNQPQQPQQPAFPFSPAPPQQPVFPAPAPPIQTQSPWIPVPQTPPQQPAFPAPAPPQRPVFPAPAPPVQTQSPWVPVPQTPPQQPVFPAPAPPMQTQAPWVPQTPPQQPVFPAPAPQPQGPIWQSNTPPAPAPAPVPAPQTPVAPAPPVYQPWWIQNYPQFNYPQFNYPQQPGQGAPAPGGPSFVFNANPI